MRIAYAVPEAPRTYEYKELADGSTGIAGRYFGTSAVARLLSE